MTLIRHEIQSELRNTYSLSTILLYLFATIFVIYSSFINIQPQTWNTLYWIIFLFIAVNALNRSFDTETSHKMLYFYQLVNPIALYIAKLIYNILLISLLGILIFLFFGLVGGNPVKETGTFLLAILLGAIGFSSVFTFIASLGSKSGNSHMLTAVLGFPCIIPIMLELLKISADALRLIQDTAIIKDFLILGSVEMLLIATSMLLFPYVWRE